MRVMRGGIAALGVCLLSASLPCLGGREKTVQVEETVHYEDFSEVDQRLSMLGVPARLFSVEYTTSPHSGRFGGTIIAHDVGNKQLTAHWVPGDPRRYGTNAISWTVDQVDLSAHVSLPDLNDAIDNAMNTWQDVECSRIPLVKIDDHGIDFGFLQHLFGFGGSPIWLADLTHAGWLPKSFFDAIVPDGGSYILGLTFTLVWIEGGVPTDIDSDGKADVAFRETYYNDGFEWSVDGPQWFESDSVDVETVVLHETGHGLSQSHFGKMFIDASDPEPPYSPDHLHFAPRAVMNAVYWDTLRELQGSDVGGHCSIWGSWPGNGNSSAHSEERGRK